MKKHFPLYWTVLLASALTLLSSCRKEPEVSAIPLLGDPVVLELTVSSVLLRGVVVTEGNVPVNTYGFSWSTNPIPSEGDGRLAAGTGTGSFNLRVTGLLPDTEYYVRIFAAGMDGTYFGDALLIRTPQEANAATVVTVAPAGRSFDSFVSGGDITDIGAGEIIERGICWNTEPAPTVDNFKLAASHDRKSPGTGIFTLLIQGLQPGERYFLRAYAINTAGIAYGPEMSIRTLAVLGTKRSELPSGSYNHSLHFSLNGRVYVGLGWYGEWEMNPDGALWEWEEETNNWTKRADFPGNQSDPVSFAIGGKGYVITNGLHDSEGNYVREFWEYDPTLDKWSRKSDFPSAAVRINPVMFSIGSRGYIGMGQSLNEEGNQNVSLTDLWEWNRETDKWTRKADYPGTGHLYPSTFVIGTSGYVCAGKEPLTSGMNRSELWEYDQNTDSWIRKADLPGETRGWPTGLSTGNKGFVGSGDISEYEWYENQAVWEWDQATDTWSQLGVLAPFTYPVAGGMAGDIAYFVSEVEGKEIWTFTLNFDK